jgi:hypothetical protein
MKSQFKGRRQRARYALISASDHCGCWAIKPLRGAHDMVPITDTGTVQITSPLGDAASWAGSPSPEGGLVPTTLIPTAQRLALRHSKPISMAKHLDLEQQEQLDEIKHFWKQYENLIIWVLIAFGAIASWNGYQYWQRSQGAQASVLRRRNAHSPRGRYED